MANSGAGAGADAQGQNKRPHDEFADGSGPDKRPKTEFTHDDPTLDNLFAPLPFETSGDYSGVDFSLDNPGDLDLPDFLSDKPADGAPQTPGGFGNHIPGPGETNGANPGVNQQNTGFNSNHNPAMRADKGPNTHNPGSFTPTTLSRTNSMPRIPDSTGNGAGPSPLYQAQAQPQNLPQQQQQQQQQQFPYQKTPASFPNQYRPPNNNPVASPSAYKPGIRFDPKRTFPLPTTMSSPSVPTASGLGTNYGPLPNAGGSVNPTDKDKIEDPTKLNDALAAAGVDIQREEELLASNYNRSAVNLHQQQLANRQRQTYGQLNSFLHPYHVALFMNKAARENGVMQNFMVDPEMLEFMSSACREWISDLVTKTVALARHRRRGIPAFNSKGKIQGKQKASPPAQRSEVSKELRNLALKQKESEERRVAKRALLGLEKGDEVAPDSQNKAGAEETLHRAANATAAMMTMNPSRKKYSWMTSGAASASDESKGGTGKDSNSKQSPLLAARGDNGLRFREIRTGNMISSKDLLGVLEDERMGTAKAVVKGYARLKD